MKPDFKASGFSSNVWSVNQSSPTRYPLCNHSKRLLFQTKPSCGLHENPLQLSINAHVPHPDIYYRNVSPQQQHVDHMTAGFSPTLSLMLLQ